MLEAGEPAVDTMAEYVRACGQLGHAVPPPARLYAAYTAEAGLDLDALDADHRTLSDALAVAEEALALQDGARHELAAAWCGAGADAAADHLLRHGQAAGAGVDRLRAAAVSVGELRDRLSQLIDAKVNATQDVEARGRRAEWLGAARTVTTGAGDRADASETVDLQLAPFVANDIARDWLPLMCDTESAIRQAYREAAAAMAGFDSAEPPGMTRVGAEQYSLPASAAPAGVAEQPASAAVPAAGVAPVDPGAGAPMPTGAAPLGSGVSGMSGLSGIGQSIADILGGLFGGGGQGLGESLGGLGDLDETGDYARGLADPEPDDEPDPEDDPDDPDGDESHDEDSDSDGDESDDEDADGDRAEKPDQAEESASPASPTPQPATPESPAPTPVPEAPAAPMAAPSHEPPVESVPAETPCEIAADALPQAGP